MRPPPPDYRRRRRVLAAIVALLMTVAGRETPVIGSIAVTFDGRLSPRVDPAWSPALAVVLSGAVRFGTLARESLPR